MITVEFGLFDLEAAFPIAYDNLPELYKNANLLNFFIDGFGNLCATENNNEFIWCDEGWVEIGEKDVI